MPRLKQGSATADARRRRAVLRRSREMLAGIVSIAPEAIVIADEDLKILLFSCGAQDIFGHKSDEVIGQPIELLMPERFRATHRGHVAAFLSGPVASRRMGERSEIVGLRRNGDEFPAQASIARLQTRDGHMFTVVLRDITAQKRTEDALMAAKLAAEAANIAKSRFLANMGHELRTPLNAIIGFSQLLALYDPERIGVDRYREYAADIQRSGEKLLAVIEDVLHLSRMDTESAATNDGHIVVSELLESTVRRFGLRAGEGGLALHLLPSAGMPQLCGDHRLLAHALARILANAVKFTPSGGRIHVSARRANDGGMELVIADTGIGMSREALGSVGQPFVQIDDGPARRYEGAGLGLAIAAGIVRLHGGRMDIESRPDQGTTVSIWLPPERVLDDGRPEGRCRCAAEDRVRVTG